MKNRLRELRQQKGLTLEEETKLLAETVSLRLSPDALAKYERGDREPKLETWLRFSKALQVSVPYLQGINVSKNFSSKEITKIVFHKKLTDEQKIINLKILLKDLAKDD